MNFFMSNESKSKKLKNGEQKNSTNNIFIPVAIVCVIICAIVIGIVGIKSGWFKPFKSSASNDITIQNENGSNSAIETNITNDTVNKVDSNTNENVTNTAESQSSSDNNTNDTKKIEISNENILNILMDTDNFIDGANLSTEAYLSIVYNALNEGYIVLDEERSNQSGKSTVIYSVDEINSIVYSLFGVELKENMSYGDVLIYKDGKYTMQFSDRGSVIPVAKNVEYDAAAGTRYITYELYYEENGSEDFRGTYTIGISGQTGFVRTKKSM